MPLFATVASLVIVALSGCEHASLVGGRPASPTTVREVYALAERTLVAGGVYHATRQVTISGPLVEGVVHQRVEMWVDAARGRARSEISPDGEDAAGTKIVVIANGIASTSDGKYMAAAGCEGSGAVTATVLGCTAAGLGTVTTDTVTVTSARHAGLPALMLARHDIAHGPDESFDIRTTTYLDPATALPFTHDERSSAEVEAIEHRRATATNASEFIGRSGLPATMYLPLPRQLPPFPPTLRNGQRLHRLAASAGTATPRESGQHTPRLISVSSRSQRRTDEVLKSRREVNHRVIGLCRGGE